MARLKKVIALVLALLFVLPTMAGAVETASEIPAGLFTEFEKAAAILNELGLFKGSDKGYELERIPNRTEAAVMLIRLLGRENAALNTTGTHPFTDVPAWADKYIAYMYTEGLTKGTSETTFDAAGACSAQMYMTFVLRALGYDDSKGDFTYDKAIAFGRIEGLISSALVKRFGSEDFLRGDMALVSFEALFCDLHTADGMLLEKLVTEKAVASDKADKYITQIKASDLLEYAYYLENDGSTYNDVENEVIKISFDGGPAQTLRYTFIWKGDYSNQSIKSMTSYTGIYPSGQTSEYTRYIVDGYVYIKDYEGVKTKTSLEDYYKTNYSSGGDEEEEVTSYYSNAGMFDYYPTVTIKQENGKTVVTRTCSDVLAASRALEYVGSIIEDVSKLSPDSYILLVKKCEDSFTLHADGYIESYTRTLEFDYLSDTSEEKVTLSISVTGTQAAPGQPVTIEFPSFDGYTQK